MLPMIINSGYSQQVHRPHLICYLYVQIIKLIEAMKKENGINGSRLKNIAEVTQEYNTTIKREIQVGKDPKRIEKQVSKPPLISKYGACLEYLLSFCPKHKKQELQVNESQITREIEILKRQKRTTSPLLPLIQPPFTKTLVLDLDQTLIHSSFKKTKNYDFTIEVELKGRMEKIYVSKRFGLDIFLFQMSQLFELILFTAGLKDYTDEVLKQIDPKNRIKHVLYRDQCTVINKTYFLKNLGLLGRDLKQTILIDDNSMAGMMNFDIFYKIDPFYGNPKDRKLLRLIEFLKQMSNESNFSCLNDRRKQYEIKTAKPVGFFNHDLQAKGAILPSESIQQSTEQSSQQSAIGKQEGTAMELVKNIEEI